MTNPTLCNDLRIHSFVNEKFKTATGSELNEIFKCFYKNYELKFKNLAYKNFNDRILDANWIGEAFGIGLMSFHKSFKKKEFKDIGASVETVFLNRCKMKLSTIIEYHQNKKETSFKDDLEDISYEEDGRWFKIEKALKQLGDKCKVWTLRKVDKKSLEEISKLIGKDAEYVKQKVYKCHLQLKAILRNGN